MSIYLRFFSCICLAITLCACGGKVELLRDIAEVEANEVMAALIEAGLSAEKHPGKDGLVSLSIEQSQFARAIALLNAEGLPHEKYVKMGDVFRKEGMISSPLEERARYLWALSQELSATVSQIDGVIKVELFSSFSIRAVIFALSPAGSIICPQINSKINLGGVAPRI